MAERPKIEVGAREAAVAILFAFVVLGVLAAAASGLFNPMLAGAIITLTVLLVLIGYQLVKMGVMTRSAMAIWYIFVLGLMLVFYGLVSRGVIPLAVASGAMTLAEVAVFTATLYTLFIVAVIGLGVALYYLMAKKKVKLY